MSRDLPNDFKNSSLTGTEQEVEFIKTVLNLSPGAKLLDLYCGYGRHGRFGWRSGGLTLPVLTPRRLFWTSPSKKPRKNK